MISKYSCYKTEFTVRQSDNYLELEGFRFDDYKLLKFSPNNKCLTKFRFKTVDAIILKITLNQVFLYIPRLDKEKVVSIKDFIDCNASTETIIRIEKDGYGPYIHWEKSPELKKMIASHREKHVANEECHQPTPHVEFDLGEVPKSFKYGFRNYEQLFRWFTLDEIKLIVNDGFSIVTYQKGRDYVESLITLHQAMMSNKLEDIHKVQYSRKY